MQWLAMFTMLIDHIGVVFYPDNIFMRVIGRIAFPIYVYLAVIGYQRTSNFKYYIIRLVALALIAQIPFQLAFNINHVNVIGTLAVGIIVIKLIEFYMNKPYIYVPLIFFAIVVLEYFSFDYGAYGLILMLLYRFWVQHGWKLLLGHVLLEVVFMFVAHWQIQFFSLFITLFLIYNQTLVNKLDSLRAPKWIWRTFYPLHLTLIYIIVNFL